MPGEGSAQRLVVMGACGSGKSTVGRQLAERLGLKFLEGDDLHPARNIELMASGVALSDADRQDWLKSIAQKLGRTREQGLGVVLACSALKRSYRDVLRSACPNLRFIHLQGSHELLAGRMADRAGHYMPVSLLQSQLDTLEAPDPDEPSLTVDASMAADAITQQVVDASRQWSAPEAQDARLST